MSSLLPGLSNPLEYFWNVSYLVVSLSTHSRSCRLLLVLCIHFWVDRCISWWLGYWWLTKSYLQLQAFDVLYARNSALCNKLYHGLFLILHLRVNCVSLKLLRSSSVSWFFWCILQFKCWGLPRMRQISNHFSTFFKSLIPFICLRFRRTWTTKGLLWRVLRFSTRHFIGNTDFNINLCSPNLSNMRITDHFWAQVT